MRRPSEAGWASLRGYGASSFSPQTPGQHVDHLRRRMLRTSLVKSDVVVGYGPATCATSTRRSPATRRHAPTGPSRLSVVNDRLGLGRERAAQEP